MKPATNLRIFPEDLVIPVKEVGVFYSKTITLTNTTNIPLSVSIYHGPSENRIYEVPNSLEIQGKSSRKLTIKVKLFYSQAIGELVKEILFLNTSYFEEILYVGVVQEEKDQEETTTEAEQLKIKNSSLERENQSLKNELQLAQDEHSNIEKEVDTMQDENTQLHGEIQELKEKEKYSVEIARILNEKVPSFESLLELSIKQECEKNERSSQKVLEILKFQEEVKKGLKFQLSEKENSLENCISKLKESTQALSIHENSINHLQADLLSKEDEISQLKNVVQSYCVKLESSEAFRSEKSASLYIKKLESELENHQNQLQINYKTISSLRNYETEAEKLRTREAYVLELCNRHSSRKQEDVKTIEEKDETITELNAKMSTQAKYIEDLLNKLAHMEEFAESLVVSASLKQEELESNGALSKTIQELQSENDMILKNHREIVLETTNKNKEILSLQEQIISLKNEQSKDIAETELKRSQLAMENEELRNLVTSLENTQKSYQSDVRHLIKYTLSPEEFILNIDSNEQILSLTARINELKSKEQEALKAAEKAEDFANSYQSKLHANTSKEKKKTAERANIGIQTIPEEDKWANSRVEADLQEFQKELAEHDRKYYEVLRGSEATREQCASRISEYAEAINSLQRELVSYKQKYENLEEELSKFKDETETVKRKYDKSQYKNKLFKQELEQLVVSSKETIKRLELEQEDLKFTLDQREKSLEEQNEQIPLLMNTIENSENIDIQIKDLSARLCNTNATEAGLRQQTALLMSDVKELERQLLDAKKLIIKLEESNIKLNSTNSALSKKHEEVVNDNRKLHEELLVRAYDINEGKELLKISTENEADLKSRLKYYMTQLSDSQKRHAEVLSRERELFREAIVKNRENPLKIPSTEQYLADSVNKLLSTIKSMTGAPQIFRKVTKELEDFMISTYRTVLELSRKLRESELQLQADNFFKFIDIDSIITCERLLSLVDLLTEENLLLKDSLNKKSRGPIAELENEVSEKNSIIDKLEEETNKNRIQITVLELNNKALKNQIVGLEEIDSIKEPSITIKYTKEARYLTDHLKCKIRKLQTEVSSTQQENHSLKQQVIQSRRELHLTIYQSTVSDTTHESLHQPESLKPTHRIKLESEPQVSLFISSPHLTEKPSSNIKKCNKLKQQLKGITQEHAKDLSQLHVKASSLSIALNKVTEENQSLKEIISSLEALTTSRSKAKNPAFLPQDLIKALISAKLGESESLRKTKCSILAQKSLRDQVAEYSRLIATYEATIKGLRKYISNKGLSVPLEEYFVEPQEPLAKKILLLESELSELREAEATAWGQFLPFSSYFTTNSTSTEDYSFLINSIIYLTEQLAGFDCKRKENSIENSQRIIIRNLTRNLNSKAWDKIEFYTPSKEEDKKLWYIELIEAQVNNAEGLIKGLIDRLSRTSIEFTGHMTLNATYKATSLEIAKNGREANEAIEVIKHSCMLIKLDIDEIRGAGTDQDQLKGKIVVAEMKATQLEEALRDAHQHIEILQEKHVKLETEMEYSVEGERVKELEKELKEYERNQEKYIGKIDKLKEKLRSAEMDESDEIGRLHEELMKADEMIKELSLDAINRNLQGDKIAEYTADIDRLTEETRELSKTIEEKEIHIREEIDKRVQAEIIIREYEITSGIQQSNEIVKTHDMQNQLESYIQHNNELQQRHQEIGHLLSTYQEEKRGNEVTMAELLKKVSFLKKSKKGLKRSVDELQLSYDNLLDQFKSTQLALESTRSQLESCNSQLGSTKAENESLASSNQELFLELQQLKAHEEASGEVYKSKLNSLREDLQTTYLEFNATTEKYRAQISILKENFSKSGRKPDTIDSLFQISKKDAMIKVLKSELKAAKLKQKSQKTSQIDSETLSLENRLFKECALSLALQQEISELKTLNKPQPAIKELPNKKVFTDLKKKHLNEMTGLAEEVQRIREKWHSPEEWKSLLSSHNELESQLKRTTEKLAKKQELLENYKSLKDQQVTETHVLQEELELHQQATEHNKKLKSELSRKDKILTELRELLNQCKETEKKASEDSLVLSERLHQAKTDHSRKDNFIKELKQKLSLLLSQAESDQQTFAQLSERTRKLELDCERKDTQILSMKSHPSVPSRESVQLTALSALTRHLFEELCQSITELKASLVPSQSEHLAASMSILDCGLEELSEYLAQDELSTSAALKVLEHLLSTQQFSSPQFSELFKKLLAEKSDVERALQELAKY